MTFPLAVRVSSSVPRSHGQYTRRPSGLHHTNRMIRMSRLLATVVPEPERHPSHRTSSATSRADQGPQLRSETIVWGNRKRSRAEEPGSDSAGTLALVEPPNAHRNAFILIGLGGAALAAFGLAAIAGIFAPFFLGVVLTICVHPLRVWLEKRGVSRGIATA